MIAPILGDIANTHGDKLVAAKVIIDENPKWAIHQGVQGIPTILFIEKGKAVDRLVVGAHPPEIKARAESLLMAAKKVHE